MKKKHIIRLAAEERQKLTDLVRKGKVAAYRRTHAQILLFTNSVALDWAAQNSPKASAFGAEPAVGKFLRCDSTVLGKELTYARLAPPGLMHRKGMFVAEDDLTLAALSSSLLNTNKLSA